MGDTIPRASQIKIIIKFVIVAIIIAIIVIFRDNIFDINKNIEDNERFYTEYNNVEIDNVFKYVTAKEAVQLFKEEKAVIFFGFKECKWCQSYVPVLNKIAKNNSCDKIYYCNIKEDRDNNTEEYKELVKLTDKYLYNDDNGNKRIYVPDVYFVKSGKIVGHNNYTSTISGADVEEYYTGDSLNKLEKGLDDLFKKIYKVCADSKKGC